MGGLHLKNNFLPHSALLPKQMTDSAVAQRIGSLQYHRHHFFRGSLHDHMRQHHLEPKELILSLTS